MTATKKSLEPIEKHKANKPGFELPVKLTGNGCGPPVIAFGFFKWKLHPLVPGLPLDAVASLPESGAIDSSTQGIGSHLSREGAAQRTLKIESQETHAIFDLDPKMYKAVLSEYLMANSLPFAHIDSPSLAKLLSYVGRCETGELLSKTRHSMRAAFDEVYRYSLEKLKNRLAAHKGRFALNLDEWKSGNNYDSLAVNLHFHNDEFELEKFVMGFEVLNDDLSYTREVLHGHLKRVLNEYDIKDRIISNTRNNAAPINTLIDKFKESFKKK